MKLKEKLELKKQKIKEQMQRGRERTAQMMAEDLRKKGESLANAKPSAITTMRQGLAMKQKPWEVMQSEYSRRKYEREQRFKKKDTK